MPDAYYGEEVMAWVKLKAGHAMTTEELQGFCHGQIMDYKVPRYVKFVQDFPKTVTGKIQRFRMREISIAELQLEKTRKQAA